MTIDELRSVLYAYIRDEINYSNDFDIEMNIVEQGLVDSMSILTLVQFLEERFGVAIEFEDINPDNFRNINAIAHFMKTLLG